jgi:hypothetical protein
MILLGAEAMLKRDKRGGRNMCFSNMGFFRPSQSLHVGQILWAPCGELGCYQILVGK